MSAPTVIVVACSPDELRLIVREVVREVFAESSAERSESHFVDRRELARRLDVSVATVTRMTSEGLPHAFVGASPRFSVAAVHEWLAARGRKGTKSGGPRRENISGVRLLSRVTR